LSSVTIAWEGGSTRNRKLTNPPPREVQRFLTEYCSSNYELNGTGRFSDLKGETLKNEKVSRGVRARRWGEFPIFGRTPSLSYPTRAPSSRLFFGAKILTNFFWQPHPCFLFAQVHHTRGFFNFISPGIQISRPLTPLGCGGCTHHEKELTKWGVLTKTWANKTSDELCTKSWSKTVSQKMQVYFWARLR